MLQQDKDLVFHQERTLYYKRLRDQTENPVMYVAYECEMQYHFKQYRDLELTRMIRQRITPCKTTPFLIS